MRTSAAPALVLGSASGCVPAPVGPASSTGGSDVDRRCEAALEAPAAAAAVVSEPSLALASSMAMPLVISTLLLTPPLPPFSGVFGALPNLRRGGA